MTISMTSARRGVLGAFAASIVGAVSYAALATPSASAAPDDCSASGLAATISSVTKATSDYLAAHPDTNQALIDITRQPKSAAIGQFDSYFKDHPQEADELRAIQQPTLAFQERCGMQVEPSEAFVVLQSL